MNHFDGPFQSSIYGKECHVLSSAEKKRSHTCLEPHKGVQMVMNSFCKDNQCNFMHTHCLNSSNLGATNCDWATGVPVPALSCWCTESLTLAGTMEHVGVWVFIWAGFSEQVSEQLLFIQPAPLLRIPLWKHDSVLPQLLTGKHMASPLRIPPKITQN